MRGVKPNLGPIGSAFLVFIGYKKKDRKQSIYIDSSENIRQLRVQRMTQNYLVN